VLSTRKKILVAILSLKLLALFGVLLIEQGIVTIGELPILAKDEPDKEKEPIEESAEQRILSNRELANHEMLRDLLDMPELDTRNAEMSTLQKYIEIANLREQKIKERLMLLAKKVENFESLKKDLQEAIKKIDEEKLFFSQSLQKEKEIKEERLNQLILLYEKMEPKKAAPVFEEMDRDLAIALFKKIKDKQVTKIFENMNPQKVNELTEYFGRIRSGSEYQLLQELNQSLRESFAKCN
jgi:flagellar motility protein MotE (MotC chaperone)